MIHRVSLPLGDRERVEVVRELRSIMRDKLGPLAKQIERVYLTERSLGYDVAEDRMRGVEVALTVDVGPEPTGLDIL